jgi:tetrahydromethanopterin S-methyltransferase subunit A
MDVFWRRNGIAVQEEEDARYTIEMERQEEEEEEEESALPLASSRFVISPVLDQDAGQITCGAANRFGRDQKHFLLSIEGEDNLLFLAPFSLF